MAKLTIFYSGSFVEDSFRVCFVWGFLFYPCSWTTYKYVFDPDLLMEIKKYIKLAKVISVSLAIHLGQSDNSWRVKKISLQWNKHALVRKTNINSNWSAFNYWFYYLKVNWFLDKNVSFYILACFFSHTTGYVALGLFKSISCESNQYKLEH